MTSPKEAGAGAEGDQSPRVQAIFDRLSARVDPPPVDDDDWESALNGMSDRPADHGQGAVTKPARIKVHPAAAVFPLLGGEDLEALADDIAENGIREPLWLYRDPTHGDVLLDGRNRLAACDLLGIEPDTRYYEGDDPTGFVLSQNLHRRHLPAGQRAAIAADLQPVFAREARERKRAAVAASAAHRPRDEQGRLQIPADRRSSGQDETASAPSAASRMGKAAEQAARAVGASPRSVERFARVKAVDPELAQQVRGGAVSLDRAERVVVERGKGRLRPSRIVQPSDAPGTEFVRELLSRLELLTNKIEGSGLTPQEYGDQFKSEIDWAEPLLVRRLAYVGKAVELVATLSDTIESAKAAIERSLPARAAGNPGAEATSAAPPPALTAEGYRRAKNGV